MFFYNFSVIWEGNQLMDYKHSNLWVELSLTKICLAFKTTTEKMAICVAKYCVSLQLSIKFPRFSVLIIITEK